MAASVWLSASVGIGAGGALCIYCTWAVVLVVFVLRLGPRMAMLDSGDGESSFGCGDTSDWDTVASEDDKGGLLDRSGKGGGGDAAAI